MHFIWCKWFDGRYRWVYWECQPPVWWKPRIEKYKFGTRFGWLIFSIGTGIVTKQMMEVMMKELGKE
jgi:hypothetical protein